MRGAGVTFIDLSATRGGDELTEMVEEEDERTGEEARQDGQEAGSESWGETLQRM